MNTDLISLSTPRILSPRGLTAGPSGTLRSLDPAGPTLRVKPRDDNNRGMEPDSPTPRVEPRGDRVVNRLQRGFTLLEVMIALLVITLGMAAVISTSSESGWKSAHLRQSTIASWVAYNEIALYRATRTWNSVKSRSGETEMANAKWEWRMEISTTDDKSLRRLDVEVTLKDETAIKARVTGFIARI
jgi:general secretion pathway protein I